jgi:catalase
MEAPWQAADNVVSRKSHWSHEGQTSEYDQVRELYLRVMTPEQRDHLHKNTAKLLVVSCVPLS